MIPGKPERPRRAKTFVTDAAALFVVVVAPFLNFLLYHVYGLAHAEVLVCFAAVALLAAAGSLLMMATHGVRILGGGLRAAVFGATLTFFFDLLIEFGSYPKLFGTFFAVSAAVYLIRRHINVVALAASLAFMVSSAIVVEPRVLPDYRAAAPVKTGAGVADLPPVIHIITDEHLGIEGIGPGLEQYAAMKDLLRGFYRRYGFRAYGRAYTWYGSTGESLTSILNFGTNRKDKNAEAGDGTDTLGNPPEDGFFKRTLKDSKYMRTLIERGYAIHVYQTDYLDMCPEKTPHLRTCYTYSVYSPKVIQGKGLSVVDRAWVLGSLFVYSTKTWGGALSAYYRVLGLFLSRDEQDELLNTVEHHPERAWISLFDSLSALDRLVEDVATAPRNSAYLVHLMLPHTPYAYSADCSLLPASAWLRPRDRFGKNTEKSWRIRYGRYFGQMTCMYRKFGAFFDTLKAKGVFDDAIVVVHGDHGSRISRQPPATTRSTRFGGPVDVLDHFSTIYAVHYPSGADAGYDPAPRPVEELLAEALGVGGPKAYPPCPDADCVFVGAYDGMRPRPIWDFGAAPPNVKR